MPQGCDVNHKEDNSAKDRLSHQAPISASVVILPGTLTLIAPSVDWIVILSVEEGSEI